VHHDRRYLQGTKRLRTRFLRLISRLILEGFNITPRLPYEEVMSSILRTEGKERVTAALESVSNGRRRRILSILRDADDPIDESTLARRLAVEDPAADASEEGTRSVRVDLAHVHLPKLEDAGLVERDDGAVTTGSHPILDEPEFDRILDGEGDRLDERLSCLAHERRRVVLTVLDGRSGPVPQQAVAHEVVCRERGVDPSAEAVESALRSLHHVHLPKLADAGLVEFDREAGTVTGADRPGFVGALLDRATERSTDGFRWLARSSG